MNGQRHSLLEGLRADFVRLADDVRRLFTLRWELWRLEARHAFSELRRLVLCVAVAVIACWVAVALACAAAVELIVAYSAVPRWLGFLGAAAVMSGLASAGGILARRRWRREYAGFEESLEELREDILWISEWLFTAGLAESGDDGSTDDAAASDSPHRAHQTKDDGSRPASAA